MNIATLHYKFKDGLTLAEQHKTICQLKQQMRDLASFKLLNLISTICTHSIAVGELGVTQDQIKDSKLEGMPLLYKAYAFAIEDLLQNTDGNDGLREFDAVFRLVVTEDGGLLLSFLSPDTDYKDILDKCDALIQQNFEKDKDVDEETKKIVEDANQEWRANYYGTPEYMIGGPHTCAYTALLYSETCSIPLSTDTEYVKKIVFQESSVAKLRMAHQIIILGEVKNLAEKLQKQPDAKEIDAFLEENKDDISKRAKEKAEELIDLSVEHLESTSIKVFHHTLMKTT